MSDFVPVKSSNAHSVRYDAAAREFHVKFRGRVSTIYVWKNVDQAQYDAFMKAESPGIHLRSFFPSTADSKLEEPKAA